MINNPISCKSIFLTGATGFLGGYIARSLVRQGHRLFCYKRLSSETGKLEDLVNYITWVDIPPARFFRERQIDAVIHCATNYGRNQSAFDIFQTNIFLPLSILHASAENQVSTFFNFDTVLDRQLNEYSLSKKTFLEWSNKFRHEVNFVNIKLHHFYGPNDNPSKFTSSVIQSLRDEERTLKFTSGIQKRDFIFIDDVVDASNLIFNYYLRNKHDPREFEIGTGTTVSIKEFVETAKRVAQNKNTELEFNALPDRENEIYNLVSDISEIQNLGWRPAVSLIEGLKRCFNPSGEHECVA